jgi:hypothetical protein
MIHNKSSGYELGASPSNDRHHPDHNTGPVDEGYLIKMPSLQRLELAFKIMYTLV